MSIKDQIHSGIKWLSGSLILGHVMGFITSVILARLLVPEMFGIMAMANITISTIGILNEKGFGAAYIQRQEKDDRRESLAADTTFILSIVLNTVLFIGCSMLSPLIADFFKSEELEQVLKVMFGVFLLNGIARVPALVLQKRLEFGKHAVCEIIQNFSNALIAIPLALKGFGVWSLVFGQLGSRLIYAVMIFRISGWRPGFRFEPGIAKELFTYGKFIYAFSVLTAVGSAIDKAVIGRSMGAASLGFYSIALTLATLPSGKLNFLINRITFPAFSKIQADKLMLKRALLKVLSHISVITLPVAFGLAAVSETFILLLYGDKWLPSVPLVKVLAFYGMSLSVSSITGPVFKAINKPNVLFYTSSVHHLIKISLLVLFMDMGVMAVCYAVLISSLISALIAFTLIINYLRIHVREILEPLARAVVPSLTMFMAVKIFEHSVNTTADLSAGVLLSVFIILGISVYFLASYVMNRTVVIDFKNTLMAVAASKSKAT